MLRSVWLLGVGTVLTLWYGGKICLLSYLRKEERLCNACNPAARGWSRSILKMAGVSVDVEGGDNLDFEGAAIVISNHESWFDVWALAGYLPIEARFIAKNEMLHAALDWEVMFMTEFSTWKLKNTSSFDLK